MGVAIDLTGRRYGMLTVLRLTRRFGDRRWICVCDCGGRSILTAGSLNSGNTRSCGCRKYAVLGESTTKHGLHGTQLYVVWKAIRQRCNNPRNKQYPDYGGRGIRFHPRWDDFAAFNAYINRYLGPRPSSKHSIDRVNNNGGYVPGNLRWATPTQQNNNSRHAKQIRIL